MSCGRSLHNSQFDESKGANWLRSTANITTEEAQRYLDGKLRDALTTLPEYELARYLDRDMAAAIPTAKDDWR